MHSEEQVEGIMDGVGQAMKRKKRSVDEYRSFVISSDQAPIVD